MTIDIYQYDVSIVFISETWWSDTSAVNINGFNLFRKDRDSRGGGVCIYIRNFIKSYIIEDDIVSAREIEQIWCTIELGSERIICGCIYHPGSSSNLENSSIIRSIKQVSSLYHKNKCSGFLVCGDFNYATINWYENYNLNQSETDKQAKYFIECLNDSFLYQNIVNPTFQVKLGTDSNVLDLIISECENRIFLVQHFPQIRFKIIH